PRHQEHPKSRSRFPTRCEICPPAREGGGAPRRRVANFRNKSRYARFGGPVRGSNHPCASVTSLFLTRTVFDVRRAVCERPCEHSTRVTVKVLGDTTRAAQYMPLASPSPPSGLPNPYIPSKFVSLSL